MENCQRKVENVFGSLQSEFIFIRSILLWKQPVYSFFAFCVLSFIGSYCTSGFFRYNVCCIVLCVLLLCLSLWVLPKVKLGAAIQRGQTSAEEKKRFEEGTLSYQRFCSIIAPVLKYAEPHWGELKKLLHTWTDYLLQTHFVISLPVAGFLVHLLLTGIIHFLVVSLWIVFLCCLWMPLQYYGIQGIIYDILEQFFSHEDTNMADPRAFTGKYKPANGKAEPSPAKSTINTVLRPVPLKKDTKCVLLHRTSAPQGLKTEFRTLSNEIQEQIPVTASAPSLKKKPELSSKQKTSHKSHGSKRLSTTTTSAPSRQIGIEKTAPHDLNLTPLIASTSPNTVPGSDNTDAIPLPHTYICSHYLMGGCADAGDCTMHHLKKPYQWLYFYGRKWWLVNDDDNDELEACFCSPDVTDENLDLSLSRVAFGIRTRYFVNFDTMTIFGEMDLPIKRLSTKSQAQLPGCSVVTKWCWYWKNENENFEEYSFQQELERQYLKGESIFEFQVAKHRYKLYFKKSPMYQINLHYKTKREVRRRPCLSSTRHESASSIIWNIMEKKKEKKEGAKKKEGYIRVELKIYDSEYRDIKSLFMRTICNRKNPTALSIESIERVENQSLWEKYSSTYMDFSGHDANERFLFHGTREQSVEGICKTNFDWRRSGESVGAIYGEATYFATDAVKSHHYTSPDSNDYRYMFVALVLVGTYTRGRKGLRIPPPKEDTDDDRFNSCVDNVKNPKTFAIFDKNQCYPAYLIKYSA